MKQAKPQYYLITCIDRLFPEGHILRHPRYNVFASDATEAIHLLTKGLRGTGITTQSIQPAPKQTIFTIIFNSIPNLLTKIKEKFKTRKQKQIQRGHGLNKRKSPR